MPRTPPPREYAALDAKIRAAALALNDLPAAARDLVLARLDRSRNPLDRTIAAEARRRAAPAPTPQTV